MLASGFSRKQVSLPEIDDLKFLSELSRSLVDKVHPKKVAGQVVEALCQKLQAKVCALVVELDNLGLVSSAVDRRGNRIDEFLRKERFRHWIKPLPPQVSFWTVEKDEFLLSASDYELEYVSPIHISSEVKGALIVGFESKEDFTEIKAILIDTTVQITTVSLNLSAHYVNAIDFSLSQVKEESRNFIESILDALPVSLYVVDRDYRIVAWNKNREMGLQGVPKEEVIGRKILRF